MRLATVDGRAALLGGAQVFDVEHASGGRLPSDPMELLGEHWDVLLELAAGGVNRNNGRALADVRLGPPVPRPPAVFSVIANFPPAERNEFPMVVGKSPTSVSGPFDDIVLPNPNRLPLGRAFVIAEPELGVVTRGSARHLSPASALDAVAGFVVAQDVTERVHEFGGAPSPWEWQHLPAKTLGKSIDTFCPIGPVLLTLDELVDPSALRTRCWIDDVLRVDANTRDMLASVSELVALLSSFMTLLPGMLCLCGSPGTLDGTPMPALAPGDQVRTEIEGIGTMVNRCRPE
ncbi:MAG: fumarylacetoacetate hydrolase family protein [Acidimicrobiia bacterium]